ncbi:MAG: hypothetical protein ACLT98_11410 [Eggerthellaceae bacterium]
MAASAGMMVIGHAAGISEQLAGLNTDQAAASRHPRRCELRRTPRVRVALRPRGRYPVMLFCMTVTSAMAFFSEGR